MKAVKLANTQNFYYPGLETIKGLQFTRREIDIIACTLGGGSSKRIASFLSISPKTVENHLHNIMLKLGCNSRENVINFIKTSGKLELIKTHYLALFANAFFEQQLKEVFTLVRKETPVSVTIKWPGQSSKNFLLHQLQKHLQLAGIKAVIETTESHKPKFHQFEPNETVNYTIQCISGDLLGKPQANNSPEIAVIRRLSQKAMQSPTSVTLVLLGKKPSTFIPEEMSEAGYIEMDEQKNYYIAIFDILKKVLPHIDLDRFVSIFMAYCEESHISSLNIFNLTPKEKTSQNRILGKKFWLFSIAFIFLLGIGLVHHHFEKASLAKEIVEINEVWVQNYEPHIFQAALQAEFYQLRGNMLNFSYAKKTAENVAKLSLELSKDIERVKERRNFININFWAWSPFNWSLKSKILSRLEEQELVLFIALSLAAVSKFMSKEAYPAAIEEISINTIPGVEVALSKSKFDDRKTHLFKKWLAILINIKSVARRMLAESKEKDKDLYRKTLNEICADLSLSLKNYDPSNFSTYLIMHYIKLMLAEVEVDSNEQKKLETEAEYYLTQGVEKAPKELVVLSAQAWHYMQKKEYDRALIALDAYLKVDPRNVAVLHNRAQACLELGEKINSPEYYKKAYVDATAANDLKPNDCNVIRLLIWSSIHVKGCKKAVNKYQKLYKPLCVDGRQAWDDVRAIRNQEAKQLESKISRYCN